MTILNVPFIYEALIIKPRCRKPVIISIKDIIQIEIKNETLASLPIAFKIGNKNLRWYQNKLWNHNLKTIIENEGNSQLQVTINEVIRHTESNGTTYKWSKNGAEAPFKNFWHTLKWSDKTMKAKHNVNGSGFDSSLNDNHLIEKEQVVCREWLDDNRDSVLQELYNISSNLISVDGIMFKTVSEPRYEVISFGAGNNYSVAMFISSHYNNNISNKSYFNALDFEKAKESLISRSSDKNIIAIPNCGHKIEVLIPDAVKCKPLLDHLS